MSHTLTRKELYDLVWMEPMRDLAKRFEIADVGLEKACRNADIPVPPRGYWNKHQAGHRVVKADLPLRRPGHSNTVTIGRDRGWYCADRLDLDEPEPAAPSFAEPIEAVRARVVKAVAQISTKTKLEILHPAIKTLLDKDETLREKQKTYAWHKPQFDDPAERRQLGFPMLFSWLSAVRDTEARSGATRRVSVRLYWRPHRPCFWQSAFGL